MHVVGIDVGSQSVKAVLVDPDGRALGEAAAGCPMAHPASGWAEQAPADWEAAMGQAVRRVLTDAGVDGAEVGALGLSCQVDGLVAIDAAGRALRPAITWLDRRATTESDTLAERAGEAALVERTGLNPDASHTAPKAMWLRAHEPEHYAAARWLAPVGGYVLGWLTGTVEQDHANASSTLLYDLRTRAWDDGLVDAAGLDGAKLPPIREATDVAGTLRPEAAEVLGLSAGCQVVVGTGDEHAAVVGAGALEPGTVVDVTGTAEPVAVGSATVVIDERRLVETHAHAVPGMLLVENPGFVSGGSTRWAAEVWGIDQGELFARAAHAPAGCDGLLFVPALSGSTAPRWNGRMRGAFAGMAMHHRVEHFARAVLEGCAFALRDIVDRFDALGLCDDEVRVVGGGSLAPLWLEIKAGVTDRPLRPVLGASASATGAAMLAGVAAGTFADLPDAARRSVALAPEPVLPDAADRAVYDDAYGRYQRLFDGLEGALA